MKYELSTELVQQWCWDSFWRKRIFLYIVICAVLASIVPIMNFSTEEKSSVFSSIICFIGIFLLCWFSSRKAMKSFIEKQYILEWKHRTGGSEILSIEKFLKKIDNLGNETYLSPKDILSIKVENNMTIIRDRSFSIIPWFIGDVQLFQSLEKWQKEAIANHSDDEKISNNKKLTSSGHTIDSFYKTYFSQKKLFAKRAISLIVGMSVSLIGYFLDKGNTQISLVLGFGFFAAIIIRYLVFEKISNRIAQKYAQKWNTVTGGEEFLIIKEDLFSKENLKGDKETLSLKELNISLVGDYLIFRRIKSNQQHDFWFITQQRDSDLLKKYLLQLNQ